MLIGLAVFGYLFALVCQWYASLTSQSVGTQLRKDMYHQINQYDDANLDTLTAPSLVTRLINDVVQIQLAVAMTIRLTSRAPFLMIGSLFMAFMISGSLSIDLCCRGDYFSGIDVINYNYFDALFLSYSKVIR